MIEVEIKVKIDDPNLIRKIFKENNAVFKFSLKHEDSYFNMPKGLRDFRHTDEALRLRKSTEINRDNKEVESIINYFITYKGKKFDNTTKTREEIEVKIDQIEDMKKLLKFLGFREIFTVVKERELYELSYEDKKIDALIDYIPILDQYFVELELITESLDNVEKSKELLFKFLKKLGIKREESVRKSYLELIFDKLGGI